MFNKSLLLSGTLDSPKAHDLSLELAKIYSIHPPKGKPSNRVKRYLKILVLYMILFESAVNFFPP